MARADRPSLAGSRWTLLSPRLGSLRETTVSFALGPQERQCIFAFDRARRRPSCRRSILSHADLAGGERAAHELRDRSELACHAPTFSARELRLPSRDGFRERNEEEVASSGRAWHRTPAGPLRPSDHPKRSVKLRTYIARPAKTSWGDRPLSSKICKKGSRLPSVARQSSESARSPALASGVSFQSNDLGSIEITLLGLRVLNISKILCGPVAAHCDRNVWEKRKPSKAAIIDKLTR